MHEFNSIRSSIKTGGLVIIIANIVIWGALINGVVWGCNQIKDKGLKNISSRIWSGDTNAPPVPTNASPVE